MNGRMWNRFNVNCEQYNILKLVFSPRNIRNISATDIQRNEPLGLVHVVILYALTVKNACENGAAAEK